MDLEREMSKTQEIIRRFDEVMSDKASKHDLRELEIFLEKYLKLDVYMDYKAELNLKFERIFVKEEKLEKDLDVLGESI